MTIWLSPSIIIVLNPVWIAALNPSHRTLASATKMEVLLYYAAHALISLSVQSLKMNPPTIEVF